MKVIYSSMTRQNVFIRVYEFEMDDIKTTEIKRSIQNAKWLIICTYQPEFFSRKTKPIQVNVINITRKPLRSLWLP